MVKWVSGGDWKLVMDGEEIKVLGVGDLYQ